ncbi:hypothetical protein DBQ04_00500 [Lactobacillus acidophilus]|uniref:Putative enterolysin A n=1 Tax=Lactobacillus acidophilus (strain ATCC 700396 / NCK56 / N2 / NCFM) TaxID=272621 RepID=Q5FJU3_LACAC|nr:putative enterolysin A [Lactobacillus acidophilus NCFM]KAB1966957.1 hypothetical protein F8247_02840 [Lactobacillus acidophilus]MBO8211373.1 hypothetical protein [Lactobacillus acidophilus]MCT3603997.1 hypothetical protein [Lactobacillus acidophilus]MCT3608526.1 hypothetical protein [Lactobacillus acidophilus]
MPKARPVNHNKKKSKITIKSNFTLFYMFNP